jgi:hypothetical protein
MAVKFGALFLYGSYILEVGAGSPGPRAGAVRGRRGGRGGAAAAAAAPRRPRRRRSGRGGAAGPLPGRRGSLQPRPMAITPHPPPRPPPQPLPHPPPPGHRAGPRDRRRVRGAPEPVGPRRGDARAQPRPGGAGGPAEPSFTPTAMLAAAAGWPGYSAPLSRARLNPQVPLPAPPGQAMMFAVLNRWWKSTTQARVAQGAG